MARPPSSRRRRIGTCAAIAFVGCISTQSATGNYGGYEGKSAEDADREISECLDDPECAAMLRKQIQRNAQKEAAQAANARPVDPWGTVELFVWLGVIWWAINKWIGKSK